MTDFVRCTCGTLIGSYRDMVSFYYTNRLQSFAKENNIHPSQLKFFKSKVVMEEIYEYLNIVKPCCRTHLGNYYDPTKELIS